MTILIPDMICDYCKAWVRPNVYYCAVEDGGHECEGRKAYRASLRNKPRQRKPWETRPDPKDLV